ncbi:MAG TPA: hypothetical protein ENN33_06025 [Ignavibacteria bacterium]|nr:hypothetical protein [Ignavibacteria bacterium]
MLTFFIWILLMLICSPIGVIALLLYPIVWLLSIPFRILGFAVDGLLKFIKAVFLFPSRIFGQAK